MLDFDGDLPYVVWYQCKSCTHLFYNEKAKILSHLRDHHGYVNGKRSVGLGANQNQPPLASSTASSKVIRSNSPLRDKEYHLRPHVGSGSSGTDGEENISEEAILNNNNNNDFSSKMTTIPRRKARNFLKNNMQLEQEKRNSPRDKVKEERAPSIEDLKRQLMKSDIDISEIKISSHGEIHRDVKLDDEEDEDEGTIEDEQEAMGISPSAGFHSESYEDQEDDEDNSEDPEEGASTSNQSFYDNEAGGHFLFQNDAESESNFDESESIMTPNFSMVDEFYRNADAASNAAAAGEAMEGVGRKRTYFNPCKLCKRNFPSLSMLKKHAKTHLNEDGGSQHVCKFCFEYFPSAAGLSKHLRVHAEENPNVCQVCAKSFTSWATLRTHMKIHSGERPFGCDHCGQRFQTKSTLDSHLRIHTGARPHVCPICSKSFRTSSPLYRHLRSVHKGLSVSVVDS